MNRILSIFAGLIGSVLLLAPTGPSWANDRLPDRLRPAFRTVRQEVQKFMDYIMVKVWRPRIHALIDKKLDPKLLKQKVDELVDEATHIMLPQSKRIMRDVVFGTGATYLRITRPELRKAALKAARMAARGALGPSPKNPADAMRAAVEKVGGVAERELNDRLQSALLEDMEDYLQRAVEGAVGLPFKGCGRGYERPLPKKWEKRYQKLQQEVHRFNYWWLRKRRRLWLTHAATTMTRKEIDRARYTGRFWRMTSGISHEAWAQNRLRIDFKWGRLNWEIDRRRIRRRMDQSLAAATWALTRVVKELMSPQTVKKLEQQLERRIREELEKNPDLRRKAEQYPDTSQQLQKRLRRLKRELDPIMNKAMSKVPLPPNMKDLAQEHGRRFMREELEGHLFRALQRQAAPHAAVRRVKDRLGSLVADALAGFDPGGRGPAEYRRRALEHVRKTLAPRLREEIRESLRASGRDDLSWSRDDREKAVEGIMKRFKIEQAALRETEKQLRPTTPDK